jgi:dTDP-glucose 4,6-dehydratase
MILPADDLDHVIDSTRHLWEEFRGARLFITGGTGFVGCWLLESFLYANSRFDLHATVTVLTRSPEAFALKAPHMTGDAAVRLLKGDVRTFVIPSGPFSHVLHAATQPTADGSPQALLSTFESIVEGTRRALDLAQRSGARAFLMTSSGAVYGLQPPDLPGISEDHPGAPQPTDPSAAYGEGKRASECLCALHARAFGLPVKIARCFAFVGPHLPLEGPFAIGNFMGNGLRGEAIQVKGDGTPFRSYLYAADMVIWLWSIFVKGESCRPYNVGSEEGLSIAEVAQTVSDCFSPPAPVSIGRRPVPGAEPIRYVPDTSRARRELGLSQSIGLKEGVRKTLRWHGEGAQAGGGVRTS